MPLFDPQVLTRFANALIAATGSEAPEAALVAEHLVDANLAGHDSHGVGMLPRYVEEFLAGRLRPNTAARQLRDDGAILMFDGGRGYGQRAAGEAMSAGIERAREHGVCLLTLRNAGHIGRVGAYGEQAVRAGLVSLHFVNVTDHAPLVAPFGGREGRYTTNPLCVAIPDGRGGPALLLDMATSRYAMGKVRVAHNRGQPLPPGMALDANGEASTDPGVMYRDPRGALLPFGEYKGSGLALVCELLAGAISGNGTVQPGNARRGGLINNFFAILADPQRLVDGDWMHAEVAAMLEFVRSAPAVADTPVQVAGEPEARSRAQRARAGIQIDPASWREIVAAAARAGLSSARIGELAPELPAAC